MPMVFKSKCSNLFYPMMVKFNFLQHNYSKVCSLLLQYHHRQLLLPEYMILLSISLGGASARSKCICWFCFPYLTGQVPARIDMYIEALEVELLCGMCTGRLGAGVPLLTLPCLHQVHLKCISAAVGKRFACPVCRFPADLRGQVNAIREDGT